MWCVVKLGEARLIFACNAGANAAQAYMWVESSCRESTR